MPTSKVYLDDDLRVVAPDQATQAVIKETDDQGNFVRERWLRIAPPDSPDAERIAIEKEADRIVAAGTRRKIAIWAVVALLVVIAIVLVLLLT